MSEIPPLDDTFGAVLIGVLVASVFYGVSCSQVFYYFSNYSEKDGAVTKAVVIATWVSDTVHQILISHSVYCYLIKGFSQPQKLDEIVWSLIVEVIFNGITAFLVQTFFAVRIWKLSHRNILITAVLATFILGEFVSVIVYVSKSITMTTFEELATLKPLSMTVNVLAVAGDVLITIVFCVVLNRVRNNLRRSNAMINLLIAFSVQTGMLTSLCAIASFISISVSPNTFIYICFYFLLGRLYCNSLLATLNVRNAVRGRGHDDLGISLHPISDSNASTVDNQKVDGTSTSKPRLWGISGTSRPKDMVKGSRGQDLSPEMPPIAIAVRRSFSQFQTTTPRSSEQKVNQSLTLDDQVVRDEPRYKASLLPSD